MRDFTIVLLQNPSCLISGIPTKKLPLHLKYLFLTAQVYFKRWYNDPARNRQAPDWLLVYNRKSNYKTLSEQELARPVRR